MHCRFLWKSPLTASLEGNRETGDQIMQGLVISVVAFSQQNFRFNNLFIYLINIIISRCLLYGGI